MGYSNLTREKLFLNTYENMDEVGNGISFINRNEVRNLYYNSAMLIRGFEERINYDIGNATIDEFENHFYNNAEELHDNLFIDRVRMELEKQLNEIKRPATYRDYFRFLLKAIALYQEKVINNNFRTNSVYEDLKGDRKQTFLSYAYFDKGLSLALFFYFWHKFGFLYVNWMWNSTNNSGIMTKRILEKALEESEQLLFLRTTNSELRVPGNNNSIRQWCSWEIGNFYTKREGEKYYTSFYDKSLPKNDILDSFKPLGDVNSGSIISA